MTLSVSLAQTPPIQHLQQGGVTIRITDITIRENRILIDLQGVVYSWGFDYLLNICLGKIMISFYFYFILLTQLVTDMKVKLG